MPECRSYCWCTGGEGKERLMPDPEPKTISLTGKEIQTVWTALNSRFAWAMSLGKPDFEEMDTIDDIIEKLRED
jgi:hypothetical protein